MIIKFMIKNIYAFTLIGGFLSTFMHLVNQYHYWIGSPTIMWILVAMLIFCAIYLVPFYLGQRYLLKWSLGSKLAVISLAIYALYVFFSHIIAIDEQVIKPIENGYAVFKQKQFIRTASLEEYRYYLARNYSMGCVLMMVFFFTLFNIAWSTHQIESQE